SRAPRPRRRSPVDGAPDPGGVRIRGQGPNPSRRLRAQTPTGVRLRRFGAGSSSPSAEESPSAGESSSAGSSGPDESSSDSRDGANANGSSGSAAPISSPSAASA